MYELNIRERMSRRGKGVSREYKNKRVDQLKCESYMMIAEQLKIMLR